MANNDHLYQYDVPGFLFVNPLFVFVRATFSSSGATVTVSTTRRQAHKGCTITGASGDYDVAGLPTGRDYHLVGIEMTAADGTVAANKATIETGSLSASAGTLTFQVRTDATGAEAAPADGAEVFITLVLDQGISD